MPKMTLDEMRAAYRRDMQSAQQMCTDLGMNLTPAAFRTLAAQWKGTVRGATEAGQWMEGARQARMAFEAIAEDFDEQMAAGMDVRRTARVRAYRELGATGGDMTDEPEEIQAERRDAEWVEGR